MYAWVIQTLAFTQIMVIWISWKSLYTLANKVLYQCGPATINGMSWIFHIEVLMCIFHLIDDFIIKILKVASTAWICALNSTLSVVCVLLVLYWKSHIQSIRRPTTSKYERNFPPLVYVENAKISVYVETPHLFNIFSESVGPPFKLYLNSGRNAVATPYHSPRVFNDLLVKE